MACAPCAVGSRPLSVISQLGRLGFDGTTLLQDKLIWNKWPSKINIISFGSNGQAQVKVSVFSAASYALYSPGGRRH